VQLIAAHTRKPIAFVSMISHGLTDYSRALRAELPHLAFLQEIDKAISAVRSVMDYAACANAPTIAVAPARRGARQKLDRILARAAGRKALSEVESKALLKAYGIACPKEAVAASEREAAALAKTIGFPVVAKAVSAALAHKSDVGGVIVGLSSPAELRAAYKRLTGPVAKRAKLALDGVLIAEQISDGLELVLGAHRDPEMGPAILVGRGGVDLELQPDVALAAPPLDERAAEALIAQTRVAKIIGGYRGKPPYDKRALVKTLVALSQLVTDGAGRIESIDVNPFLLKRKGGVALDALVTLG
jgi:acetyltransferase